MAGKRYKNTKRKNIAPLKRAIKAVLPVHMDSEHAPTSEEDTQLASDNCSDEEDSTIFQPQKAKKKKTISQSKVSNTSNIGKKKVTIKKLKASLKRTKEVEIPDELDPTSEEASDNASDILSDEETTTVEEHSVIFKNLKGKKNTRVPRSQVSNISHISKKKVPIKNLKLSPERDEEFEIPLDLEPDRSSEEDTQLPSDNASDIEAI